MIDELHSKLKTFGQEHLLTGIETLTPSARETYLAALNRLDLPYLTSLYRHADVSPTLSGTISPCRSVAADQLTPDESAAYLACGRQLIHDGAVAVVTMAGGQGTRLGYHGPKGCFDVGVGTSLFGLLAGRIRHLEAETDGCVPWYIMTSVENHAETVAFFEQNDHFGLSPDRIFFFRQGMLPLLDTAGRILLADVGKIAEGPDGNGGVFAALAASGALDDMAARQIQHVFFCGIDNALARPADPLFVGFFERDGAPCASKSVRKSAPEERVGVFCLKDGHPCVIEYTELTPDMRAATNDAGALLYGDANIVTHMLRFDALKTVCSQGLPMHTAHKAIPYYAIESGTHITPDKPNALKFESFIFDAFASLDRMVVFQVERTREFAPVKNASGTDSPETALNLLRQNGY